MKVSKIFLLALGALLFISCGKPGVDLTNAPYEPKIAVEGYLYPGKTVGGIRLSRNVPIGSQANNMNLSLTPSEDNVVISINGIPLSFDSQTKTYYNDQIAVEYGKSYTMEVAAQIDGRQLHAASTTTTPTGGFTVQNHDLGTFPYNSSSITVNFQPSLGTCFYAFSIVSDTTSTDNFIYNNDYASGLDSSEVVKDLNSYRFSFDMLSDLDPNSTSSHSYSVKSYSTWFYSSYTMVVYAGDKNLKDYLITAPFVHEGDGNFHEPVEIFQGDGIGVFASAIIDTVRFSISR